MAYPAGRSFGPVWLSLSTYAAASTLNGSEASRRDDDDIISLPSTITGWLRRQTGKNGGIKLSLASAGKAAP